jgi:hypothetical protein
MLDFKAGKVQASRDLREMAMRTGGSVGTINFQGTRTPAVRLQDNLYATDETISAGLKMAAIIDKADIHSVKGYGDFHYFLQRYAAFRRADEVQKPQGSS